MWTVIIDQMITRCASNPHYCDCPREKKFPGKLERLFLWLTAGCESNKRIRMRRTEEAGVGKRGGQYSSRKYLSALCSVQLIRQKGRTEANYLAWPDGIHCRCYRRSLVLKHYSNCWTKPLTWHWNSQLWYRAVVTSFQMREIFFSHWQNKRRGV